MVGTAEKAKSNPLLARFLSINTLLVFLPIALLAKAFGWDQSVIFITAALAIIPLSELVGHSTEVVAARLGQRIGGLINATLGNAAELIITIFALRAGLVDLVKASIVGSILGNLLLVMGLSLLFGGLKNGIQTFERRTAGLNATMVILSFMILAIPSIFDPVLLQIKDQGARELFFSEGIAVIMIIIYALFMVFSLRTPSATLLEHSEEAAASSTHANEKNAAGFRNALIMLSLATIGIVFMSEALVGSVEHVAQSIGLSHFFVGIIVVPLIGNVAEHLVAVQVAYKNRMDLSLSISLGSSLQIALFVAPVLVFVSLLMPKQLLLVFNSYELVALAVASLVAALVAQDGESNWMEGVQLLAVYIIFALAFFLMPSIAAVVAH